MATMVLTKGRFLYRVYSFPSGWVLVERNSEPHHDGRECTRLVKVYLNNEPSFHISIIRSIHLLQLIFVLPFTHGFLQVMPLWVVWDMGIGLLTPYRLSILVRMMTSDPFHQVC